MGAGSILDKRKSRFGDKIEFGYINNNHVFSKLPFTKSFLGIISIDPFMVAVAGDIHAEKFI